MLQGLKRFSHTSGLFPNPEKSALYCAGIDKNIVQKLVDIAGFTEGTLPLTYLGIPIYAKRMPIREGEILIDKMVDRIHKWKAKNLSYAGRLVLIKSVLLSISIYWSQIIIMPASWIKRINGICRSFLWKGDENNSGSGVISWKNVC